MNTKDRGGCGWIEGGKWKRGDVDGVGSRHGCFGARSG